MIVDLEKLKKARTAVGVVWTTMDTDSALANDVLYAQRILLDLIDEVDLGAEQIGIEKEGGTDGVNKGTEAGSDTKSGS